jgi:hypothetical protein
MSFSEVLGLWPDTHGSAIRTVAHDLDLSYWTVHAWGRRNSIPRLWWEALADSAIRHRIRGVTYSSLQKLDEARWPSHPTPLRRTRHGAARSVTGDS